MHRMSDGKNTAFYNLLCTFPVVFVSKVLKHYDNSVFNPDNTKKPIYYSHFIDQETEGNRKSMLVPILVL